MEKICGQFISSKESNHSFVLQTANGYLMTCYNISPDLLPKMPIAVYGKICNGMFQVYSVEFDSTNRDLFVKFFSGRLFKGMTKTRTNDFYDRMSTLVAAYSLHDFQSISRESTFKLLELLNCPEATKKLVVEQLYSLSDRMNILELIRDDGGTFADADKVYEIDGPDAYQKLSNQPYTYTSVLSFGILDSIAYWNHVPINDLTRLISILTVVSQRIYQSGATYTTVEGFLESCHYVESLSKKFESLPDDLYLKVLLETGILSVQMDEGERHIYPSHFLYTEKRIASELKRLCNGPQPIGYRGTSVDDRLDDDQKSALSFLETSGVKIITGGPGSGKTTLIKKMITEYLSFSDQKYFYLTAPTGRAAARIHESTGFPSQTIHKLLQFQPYFVNGEIKTTYNKENQLSRGLYIIDEMSMVGEELFLMMLEAIPTGSTVILSGDPRQLPSVEAGNVLLDLIRSKKIPVQELTHIHRQKGESLIIENYLRVRNYDPDLMTDSTFSIFRDTSSDGKDTIRALAALKSKFDRTTDGDPYSFQILSLVKKGSIGRNEINNFFVEEKEKAKIKHCGKSSFCVGDKVIMTRNNYEYGYFNGDIGVITSFDDSSLLIKFYDGVKTIPRKCLPDVEHADAITVHKSQGSEYETVAVVVDDQFPNMLYNSMILTAITRAKKRVFIITRKNALGTAIVFTGEGKRTTGLTYRLDASI